MKKYSEVFLDKSKHLKDAQIGFEFEFYMKDLSYYKTLEMLNQYLSPVKVWGFKTYHSDFKPDQSNFKLEPDLSGGQNMCELITGPLPYFEAKFYLIKILKFIQQYGYTNDKSSIHFNISFLGERNLNDLNTLKLILTTDEDEIYRAYPSRKDNVYAKTVKKVIPFKQFDYNNIGIEVVKNTIRLPDDKYYGINFLHITKPKESQRLEYRYIGGKDYEQNVGQILYFMDKFILDVYDSIGAGFSSKDVEELETYLDKNISNFKNFSKYDNFIVDFPGISLQVDQIHHYDTVNAYYDRIFPQLHKLIDATDSLKDCIINFNTANQKIEIVDAEVKATQNIHDFDFINCRIRDGIFEDCDMVNSEITNCQLSKSKLHGCDVEKSKVLNCYVEASQLKECFFMNGYLNSDMFGGIFRSGKLGPYANISSDTKIVTDANNFFDTRYDEEGEGLAKDKKTMGIKSYK